MITKEIEVMDIPKLERLEEIKQTLNKLQHLINNRKEKVVFAGRTWMYPDYVGLAYEYYVLGQPYGLKLDNFKLWLDSEKPLLAKLNLAWPIN